MKANFQCIEPVNDWMDLDAHAEWLASFDPAATISTSRTPPEGYEAYHCIDVVGPEFVWLNESFPADKFTWYVWFESIFLVPDNMITFLRLKWPT
jgi:hypothetical protein